MSFHDWSKPEPCPECQTPGRLVGPAAQPDRSDKSEHYECPACGQPYGRSTNG
jgi:hypothetical protein